MLSVIPTLPGFVRAVGGPSYGIPVGASYVYSCVWPVGTTVAALAYYLLNVAFPYKWQAKEVVQSQLLTGQEETEKMA